MSTAIVLIRRQAQQEIAAMAPPPKHYPGWHGTSVAFVRLVMEFIDGDGDAVRTETWTIGTTVRGALGAWKRQHPMMAQNLVEHEVVTAGKRRVIYEGLAPLGPRVKVKDVALERVAVGL